MFLTFTFPQDESFLTQTNALGVVTGQPADFTSQTDTLGVVTGQPVAVTNQPVSSDAVTTTELAATPPLFPDTTLAVTSVRTAESSTPPVNSESGLSSTRTTAPFTHTVVSSNSIIVTTQSIAATSSGVSSSSKSDSSPSSSPVSSSAAATTTSPSSSSSGLDQSAKIGIGLGVPLGLLITAIFAYMVYRYSRNKKISRGRHVGNIAAAGLYPAADNADAEKLDAVAVQAKDDDNHGVSSVSGKGELHGDHIPPYTRELEGSPGLGKRELP